MKIYLNGQIIDAADARISILDRGFLFGEGVFETMRVYQGKIPFVDKHLDRMEWSATFIGIPFMHPTEIMDGLRQVITQNEIKEGYLKIILSAVGESFRPLPLSEDCQINLAIVTEPFKPIAKEKYEMGYHLVNIHEIKNDPAPASCVKTLSWLTKTIARREIAEKGADEGVLANAHGIVCEATSANLFWVKEDVVYTPPMSVGLLPGVTRNVVMQVAKESGFTCKEDHIKPQDLAQQTEIFITNSTLEIMPVTTLDQNDVGDGKVGKVTQELMEAYQERIAQELED